MNRRRFTDAQIQRMTLDDINDALRSYRPDLRASRADAVAFVQAYNRVKTSTIASLIDADGTPCVIAVERPA